MDDRRTALSRQRPVAGWSHYYGTAGFTPLEQQRADRFEQAREPLTLTWDDGMSFQLAPGDQSSRAVYISSTYEPNTLCVLRSILQVGDTFIDAGANAGLITLAASQWVGSGGRIHAFEPSVREFVRLRDTIARNGLHNVVAVPLALGASRGTGSLHIADDVHAGLNTMSETFPYDGIDLARLERVDIVRLDDYASEQRISAVAAIKMDVEGYEVSVIEGARELLARARPVLIVEVLRRALEAAGTSIAHLEQVLQDGAFSLCAIREDGELEEVSSLQRQDGQNVVAVPHEQLRELILRHHSGLAAMSAADGSR